MLATCATAACITFVANRPDIDDAFYLSVPATLLRFPNQPILLHDTIYRIPTLAIQLPVYRVHSYEVLIGVLASLLGKQPIIVAHMLLPPCFAALSVIVWAQLLRVIAPTLWLPSLVVLLFCVLALGEAHHSYGNFAFVRIFQGKAILATTIAPMIIYLALAYSNSGNLRDWLLLFAAQIAAIGITSSGLFVVPATAAMALAGTWSQNPESSRRVALGLLASSYVLMACVILAFATDGGKGFVSAVDMPPLSTLITQTFGPWSTGVVLTTLLASWAFAETPALRRLLQTISLCFLLVALNPFVYAYVAHHLTGTSTYWRLTWALPLPFMLAIMLVGLGREALSLRPKFFAGAAIAAFMAGAIVFFAHTNCLRSSNFVRLGIPGIKAPPLDYSVASQVVEASPENGTVLAPESVAVWIPSFVVHPNILAVRALYLPAAFVRDESDRRLALMQYVSGEIRTANSPAEFVDALSRYALTVVVVSTSPWHDEIGKILSQRGWHDTNSGAYEIWTRVQGVPNRAPHSAVTDANNIRPASASNR